MGVGARPQTVTLAHVRVQLAARSSLLDVSQQCAAATAATVRCRNSRSSALKLDRMSYHPIPPPAHLWGALERWGAYQVGWSYPSLRDVLCHAQFVRI